VYSDKLFVVKFPAEKFQLKPLNQSQETAESVIQTFPKKSYFGLKTAIILQIL